MPKSALPEHLRDRPHEDYPWGLRWIPRAWTAFKWGAPWMVAGTQRCGFNNVVKPIGPPGTWQISKFYDSPFKSIPIYFAFTTKRGIHFRIGARWDDVDSYVEWPSIAIKRGVTG